ncbi:MAG: DUF1801 domain-containing protein [Spirochaetes bacterium]|nr:DUF1801 domain-containing protein [Spirochaetota bacterium]
MDEIDEYIERFAPDVKNTLREIRAFIKQEVPQAEEKISYKMPTFYLNGNLVHYAAFKDHYGFFPAPSGIDAFEKELAPYRSGKGTLRFPFGEPIPWELIRKIVRFRVTENLSRAGKAGGKK